MLLLLATLTLAELSQTESVWTRPGSGNCFGAGRLGFCLYGVSAAPAAACTGHLDFKVKSLNIRMYIDI